MQTINPPAEATFEIIPPDVESASAELTVPSNKALELFLPFKAPFEVAAKLLAEEEAATTAADARALRLKMVKARTSISATKDESKSDIKLSGSIIDWYHNKGRDRLAASEARLMEIEKAEERAEAARIEAIRQERAEVLDSIGHNYHGVNLGPMAEEHWSEYLQQAKDLFEVRKARAEREAEEAAAELAKQEAEREAARLDAIRQTQELEAAKAALAAAEKMRLEEARKAAETAEIERQKARAEAVKAAAVAKAERERIEAIAAEEQRKALEAAAIESAKREAAEREAQELRYAEAKRIAEIEAAAAAKAKAEKKAAAAPDKVKLMEFAEKVGSLVVPLAKSEAGREVAAEIERKVESFAKWIATQASTL